MVALFMGMNVGGCHWRIMMFEYLKTLIGKQLRVHTTKQGMPEAIELVEVIGDSDGIGCLIGIIQPVVFDEGTNKCVPFGDAIRFTYPMASVCFIEEIPKRHVVYHEVRKW
jgi:hypothetical protein